MGGEIISLFVLERGPVLPSLSREKVSIANKEGSRGEGEKKRGRDRGTCFPFSRIGPVKRNSSAVGGGTFLS